MQPILHKPRADTGKQCHTCKTNHINNTNPRRCNFKQMFGIHKYNDITSNFLAPELKPSQTFEITRTNRKHKSKKESVKCGPPPLFQISLFGFMYQIWQDNFKSLRWF